MSTEFFPDTVPPGDPAGFGLWLMGHGRQHLRYVDRLAANMPFPIVIPTFPLFDIGETEFQRRTWLDIHQQTHATLRPYANITGVDLSLVDFEDETAWFQWMDVHAAEHRLIDQAFGFA